MKAPYKLGSAGMTCVCAAKRPPQPLEAGVCAAKPGPAAAAAVVAGAAEAVVDRVAP